MSPFHCKTLKLDCNISRSYFQFLAHCAVQHTVVHSLRGSEGPIFKGTFKHRIGK